jgi:hypothetical protein
MLDRAAGRKVYRLPRVLSPEEQVEQKDRMRERFSPLHPNLGFLKAA